MEINRQFWEQQRVLVTGHTGFKGAWLCVILDYLGAEIYGLSIAPPTKPNLYEQSNISKLLTKEFHTNIQDLNQVTTIIESIKPTLIFHLAAQSLVIDGYEKPIETFQSNVIGTVNILEASRNVTSLSAAIIITTDKCYENTNLGKPFKETDPLGGHDPYSSSKACAEIATHSYRKSFFKNSDDMRIATARAGNVIGGGDWANNRLLPDCVRAFEKNQCVTIRQPGSTRPWQHVLEPLYGYLLLAEQLCINKIEQSSFNFGPPSTDELKTEDVATIAQKSWGNGTVDIKNTTSEKYKEAELLHLDSSQAKRVLGWQTKWDAKKAIEQTVHWHKEVNSGTCPLDITKKQIDEYFHG